jgi:hypothetical protein
MITTTTQWLLLQKEPKVFLHLNHKRSSHNTQIAFPPVLTKPQPKMTNSITRPKSTISLMNSNKILQDFNNFGNENCLNARKLYNVSRDKKRGRRKAICNMLCRITFSIKKHLIMLNNLKNKSMNTQKKLMILKWNKFLKKIYLRKWHKAFKVYWINSFQDSELIKLLILARKLNSLETICIRPIFLISITRKITWNFHRILILNCSQFLRCWTSKWNR